MIAQLGERQTEHPKIPGSNPGRGTEFIILLVWLIVSCFIHFNILKKKNSITLVAVLNNAIKCILFSIRTYLIRTSKLRFAKVMNIYSLEEGVQFTTSGRGGYPPPK